MLRIMIFIIFIIVVLFFGYLLWNSLFVNRYESNTSMENGSSKDSMALYTFLLAVFTGLLVVASLFQNASLINANNNALQSARAAENTANAAIENNKISRDIMIAEQRPWVTVDFSIVTPLAYDDEGWDLGKRWHITLEYKLKNIGKTPATNASFSGNMLPFVMPDNQIIITKENSDKKPFKFGADITEKLDKVCKTQEKLMQHNLGFGQILFPGESRSAKFVLNVGDSALEEIKKSRDRYSGQFLIIVCVSYGSTYTDEVYHTAKAFQIFKHSGDKTIRLDGEVVPINDISIAPCPQGSFAK